MKKKISFIIAIVFIVSSVAGVFSAFAENNVKFGTISNIDLKVDNEFSQTIPFVSGEIDTIKISASNDVIDNLNVNYDNYDKEIYISGTPTRLGKTILTLNINGIIKKTITCYCNKMDIILMYGQNKPIPTINKKVYSDWVSSNSTYLKTNKTELYCPNKTSGKIVNLTKNIDGITYRLKVYCIKQEQVLSFIAKRIGKEVSNLGLKSINYIDNLWIEVNIKPFVFNESNYFGNVYLIFNGKTIEFVVSDFFGG